MTSLCGFQPSQVVLCMQNSVFRTRITSLCRSKTSLWICSCKTVCLVPKLQVSMGPSLHLRFCAFKTAYFSTTNTRLYGSQTSPVDLCRQNRDFRTRITSLYGSQPSPVALCMQNNVISITITSLYRSQPSSVDFCKQNRVLSSKITSLYVSQTTPMDLCMQNSDFRTRITSLYGSQTSPVILCMQNGVLSIRITSLYWSQPSSVVFARKTAPFGQELKVSMGPRPHLSFCAWKTA